MNIDGHWKGYYLQTMIYRRTIRPEDVPENRFPIEAWFESSGSTLTGRMEDMAPEFDCLYADYVAARIWEIGFLSWLNAKLQSRHYPGALFRQRLPKNSILEGAVDGNLVRFIKTYEGSSEAGIIISGREFMGKAPGAPILYEGILQDTGRVIVGNYRLQEYGSWDRELGRLRAFRLERAMS